MSCENISDQSIDLTPQPVMLDLKSEEMKTRFAVLRSPGPLAIGYLNDDFELSEEQIKQKSGNDSTENETFINLNAVLRSPGPLAIGYLNDDFELSKEQIKQKSENESTENPNDLVDRMDVPQINECQKHTNDQIHSQHNDSSFHDNTEWAELVWDTEIHTLSENENAHGARSKKPVCSTFDDCEHLIEAHRGIEVELPRILQDLYFSESEEILQLVQQKNDSLINTSPKNIQEAGLSYLDNMNAFESRTYELRKDASNLERWVTQTADSDAQRNKACSLAQSIANSDKFLKDLPKILENLCVTSDAPTSDSGDGFNALHFMLQEKIPKLSSKVRSLCAMSNDFECNKNNMKFVMKRRRKARRKRFKACKTRDSQNLLPSAFLANLPKSGKPLISGSKIRMLHNSFINLAAINPDVDVLEKRKIELEKLKFEGNHDVEYLVLHAEAFSRIVNFELEKAEDSLGKLMTLVRTKNLSNYGYFLLKTLNLTTYLWMKQTKLNVLESDCQMAEGLIQSDPATFHDAVAGWIYMHKARQLSYLMTSKNPERSQRIHAQVMRYIQRSKACFAGDSSWEGRYGYLLCCLRLASMHLHFDEHLTLMALAPAPSNIERARHLIAEAETLHCVHSHTGKTEYYKTLGELSYRLGDFDKAHYYFKSSYENAVSVKYNSETTVNRLRFDSIRQYYQPKMSCPETEYHSGNDADLDSTPET